MVFIVTMFIVACLSCSKVSGAQDDNGFNYSKILEVPPWPVTNCSKLEHKCIDPIDKDGTTCQLCDSTGNCTVRVTVMLPNNSFYIANLKEADETLQEAQNKASQLLPFPMHWSFQKIDDECSAEKSLMGILKANANCSHVVLGPICDYAIASPGRLTKYVGYYGIPMLTSGGLVFDFTNKKTETTDEMYMVVNTGSVDYRSYAEFFFLIADRYNWTKVALMYEKDQQNEVSGDKACHLFLASIMTLAPPTLPFDYVDGDLQQLGMNYSEFLATKVGVDYGIILSCTSHDNFREILKEAVKLKMMDNNEYLFLNLELYNNASYPDMPWYEANDTDENNEMVKKGYQSTYTILPLHETDFDYVKNQKSRRGSAFLDGLYDGLLIYAQTVRDLINPTVENPVNQTVQGCEVVQAMMGKTFQGRYGNITMNCNAQRVAEYAMLGVDTSGKYQILAKYSILNKIIYEWNMDNRTLPSDTPICGFDWSKCPTHDTVNILLISLSVVTSVCLLIVAGIMYRHLKLKHEILKIQPWKVNYGDIVFFPKERRSSIHSIIPRAEDEMSIAGDRQLFTTVGFYKSIRVAVKHLEIQDKINLNHKNLYELKVMKDLSNDNLVKFYGACLDNPKYCILTEYCQKGSLQDILENSQVQLDWTFRISLIMDLVRGMHYLHHGPLKSHGNLKSSNCLVDSRFVLKVADFGFTFLRPYLNESQNEVDSYEYWKRYLWTAPELLRTSSPPPGGTQKGDVYSFAIIMHEIINRQGVFYLGEDTYEPKYIVEKVRAGPDLSGEAVPLRPSIEQGLSEDYENEITSLMQKCWSDDPSERPDFATLKTKLRQMYKKENEMGLLDNLLTRMEQYANNLEALVHDRTKDYLEEKRKCEDVLYQLLPKSVAHQLIMGKPVVAETFSSVTIYFSDIVGFTALSAESSPMQVVDFLNDLYTMFDSIVEKFEVYKVETIGDAYMVVSGLPQPNGQKHAYEIARMSLSLLNAVQQFTIRHRPETKLRLRIGLHSGPCAAGVIGHKMPRYCLFGDTVNTASRMEANGLPLRIHISPQTKEILDQVGRFDTELRGDVELKGKGKVTTYWLNGESLNNEYLGNDQVVPDAESEPEAPSSASSGSDASFIIHNSNYPLRISENTQPLANHHHASNDTKQREEVPLLSLHPPFLDDST